MQVIALRLTTEEKARLEQIAEEQHVALVGGVGASGGARLYADDAVSWIKEQKAEEGTDDGLVPSV